MKRTIIWLLAMTGLLLATSCLKEEVLSQSTGDEVVVSFTTEFRQAAKTKAIGDDTQSIDKLYVVVYQVTGEGEEVETTILPELGQVISGEENLVYDITTKKTTATVNLVLAKGQTYRFAFWAQNSGYDAYIFDSTTGEVAVKSDWHYANTASADAFYASTEPITVTSSFSQPINLKRPFAQVNFMTSETDLNAAAAAGFVPEYSSVKVTGVATTFDVLSGEATAPSSLPVTYKTNDIHKVDGNFESVTIGETTYYYLATAYVLTTSATDATTVSAVMEITNSEPLNAGEITVRRNYRTNVYGDLLTSKGVFNVTVAPGFAGPDYATEYIEPTPVYDAQGQTVNGVHLLEAPVFNDEGVVETPAVLGVANADGLKWMSQNLNEPITVDVQTRSTVSFSPNESVIKLEADIDLSEANWDPIGDNRTDVAFTGEFDGAGHTIKGVHITGDHCFNGDVYGNKEGWGLFAVVDGAIIKNLNIDGATFGSYTVITGTIAGYANNTTFENINITNTKIAGYNWYTGGVVGWAQGECTFENVNLAENVVVGTLWDSHGQNAGGIAGGIAASSTITIKDCNVACVMDVINDVTSNYKWCVYRVSGMLIGNTNTTETVYNEVVTATATNVTCENVTVTYGKWMNYHYCEGFWNRGWGRYESSDYIGGVDEDEPHNHAEGEEHLACFPFDQLFGGSSNGSGHYPVKGLAEFEGVTVIYPEEYTCPVCGQQHNVKNVVEE